MAEHIGSHRKDADAELDYSINWDDGYLNTGESISTSIWSVPSPLTIKAGSLTNDGKVTGITLEAGGVVGERYRVVNTVTTSGGRTDDRTLVIMITEK